MIAGTLEIQLMANIARLNADMNKAVGVVNNSMKSIETAVIRTKNLLASFGVGVSLGLVARQVQELADEYTKFTAQIRIATLSQLEYSNAVASVRDTATKSQMDLSRTGVLYARIMNATRELGISQQKVSDITEIVSLALKAGGATAMESASAMLQLSQAFGSGVLRGEEFNAVNEAAPRLMKALADGMGVPIGMLKVLAENGKLTAQVLANAFGPDILAKLREEAPKVQTIGGAFTVLRNKMMEFVGMQAQASDAVSTVTKAVQLLADNFNVLVGVIGGLLAMKFSQWVIEGVVAIGAKIAATSQLIAAAAAERAAAIASAQAEVKKTAETIASITATRAKAVAEIAAAEATIAATAAMGFQSAAMAANLAAREALAVATGLVAKQDLALAAAQTAQTAATVGAAAAAAKAGAGMTALRAVLGFLGGPIGLITTALGIGAAAWIAYSTKAEEAMQNVKKHVLQTSAGVVESLRNQREALRQRNILAMSGPGGMELAKSGSEAAKEAGALLTGIQELQNKPGGMTQADVQVVTAMAKRLHEIKEEQAGVTAETETWDRIQRGKKVPDFWTEYATKTEKATVEIKKWKEALGDLFTPEMEKRIREHFKESGSGNEPDAFKNLKKGLEERLTADKQLTAMTNLARDIGRLDAKELATITPARRQELALLAQKIDLKVKEAAAEKMAEQVAKQAFEEFKAQQSHRIALLEDAHDRGLVTEQEFYGQQVLMAKETTEKEIAELNRLEEAYKKQMLQHEQGSEKYFEIERQIAEVDANRVKALNDFGRAAELVWMRAAKAAETYQKAMQDIDTQMLEIMGKTGEAAGRQFDRQYENLYRQAMAEGKTEDVIRLEGLRKQKVGSAEFGEQRTKLGDSNTRLQIEEERIQNSLKVGAIDELESLRRTSAARQGAIAEQEKMIVNLERIAKETQNPALILQAEQARAALEKLRLESDLLAQKFDTIFTGAARDAFMEFIEGSKSAKEAFKSFTDSIWKEINKLVSDALARKLMSAIGLTGENGQAGGISGWLAQLLGGPAKKDQPYQPFPGVPGPTGGVFGIPWPGSKSAQAPGTEIDTRGWLEKVLGIDFGSPFGTPPIIPRGSARTMEGTAWNPATGSMQTPLPTDTFGDIFKKVEGTIPTAIGGSITDDVRRGELGWLKDLGGNINTELSETIKDARLNGGLPTNIPSLVQGQVGIGDLQRGMPMTDPQYEIAVQRAMERVQGGGFLPSYPSIDDAVKAAQDRTDKLPYFRDMGGMGDVTPPEGFDKAIQSFESSMSDVFDSLGSQITLLASNTTPAAAAQAATKTTEESLAGKVKEWFQGTPDRKAAPTSAPATPGVRGSVDEMIQMANAPDMATLDFFDTVDTELGDTLNLFNSGISDSLASFSGGFDGLLSSLAENLSGLFNSLSGSTAGGGGMGNLFSSVGDLFSGSGGGGDGELLAGLSDGFFGDLLSGIAMFDTGTDFVPKTGIAVLHKGEAVVPASQNNRNGNNSGGGSQSIVIHQNFTITDNVNNQSKTQIAASAAEGARRALARNG